uniref:Uncharacterized protein n=1 Tax=Steinernema glaseri TaxID=37863 RepID=A0A1I7YVN4_9BILA
MKANNDSRENSVSDGQIELLSSRVSKTKQEKISASFSGWIAYLQRRTKRGAARGEERRVRASQHRRIHPEVDSETILYSSRPNPGRLLPRVAINHLAANRGVSKCCRYAWGTQIRARGPLAKRSDYLCSVTLSLGDAALRRGSGPAVASSEQSLPLFSSVSSNFGA